MTLQAEAESTLPQSGPRTIAGVTWLVPAALAFIAACFAFRSYAGDAQNLLLRDPDNFLRLAEIRDWLAGQSWWDVTQYRMAPPEGVRMHWSRLADLPVAGAISLLALFVSPERAEILAVVAVPPLLLLCLLLLLARGGKTLGGHVAATAAPILTLTVPMILAQFIPGRIDHHGLQLLCITGGMVAALGSECRRNGVLLAFAMAYSLVVGLEALPMFALIVVWLVLRWIFLGEPAFAKLFGFVAGFAVCLPFLHFISTSPEIWFQATSDQVGRGHLAVTLAGAATLLIAFRQWRRTRNERMLAVVAASAGAFAALTSFPEILQAPYSDLDELTNEIWMSNIAETSSIFDSLRDDPIGVLLWFTFPLLASALSVWLVFRDDSNRRCALLAMLTIGGIVFSAWQIRMNAMASLPAIFVTACLIDKGWLYWKQTTHLLPLVLVCVFMNGALGPMIVYLARQEQSAGAELTEAPSTSCTQQIIAADLDRFPSGLVLTSTSFGGTVLVHSHHSILSSSSHRNHVANSEAFRMLMAPPDQAVEMLRANNVDYILTCRNFELGLIAEEAPSGLLSAISTENPVSGIGALVKSEVGSFSFYKVSVSDELQANAQ